MVAVKFLLLGVFILVLAIYYYYLCNNNLQENMSTKKVDRLIILGDSIFKNNMYVKYDESVEYLLGNKVGKETKIQFLAQNDAKIETVRYSQLPKIQPVKPSETIYIYVSVGGNDILDSLYIFMETDKVAEIFNSYKRLIRELLVKYPEAVIYLATIYYPVSSTYQKYHKVISIWNNMLKGFIYGENNVKLNIFNIHKLLSDPGDFTNNIEPSVTGSKKIVTHMDKTLI